jgi:hypothetical protein
MITELSMLFNQKMDPSTVIDLLKPRLSPNLSATGAKALIGFLFPPLAIAVGFISTFKDVEEYGWEVYNYLKEREQ